MGLVLYALKFRATFFVLSLMVIFLGGTAVVSMPKDVFPNVDIPVVTVIWSYSGLPTQEMERRVTTFSEFGLSNNVNGIRNIESQTLQGVTVEKIYFQPDVNLDLAIAQVVSNTNSIRAIMPPGINAPIVVRYSASSVPVVQLSLSSDTLSEQQLVDFAQIRVRQAITQVPGSTLPSPFGGRPRQIQVDLDPAKLQAVGLTAQDVAAAINVQNLTLPSGLAKIGDTQYPIRLNGSPDTVAALNDLPLRIVNGTPLLVRDVAQVRDAGPPQVNIVRADGGRAVLISILKNGNASTLSVVNTVLGLLPALRAAAPPGVRIEPLFDQSVFVSHAIEDVLREGAIAAALTALMILLFLGSWRPTLIVLVSIPLSVLTSLAVLGAIGATVNIMTLGGLALAVGILVDDATVAIENTYRLLEEGKPFRTAVVEGGAGIAKPALISTLVICCAFVSVLFLTDAAAFLFTPLALAVVFAMLASYVISRTLVPILIDILCRNERFDHHLVEAAPAGFFGRFRAGFERGFEAFRRFYLRLLGVVLAAPKRTAAAALLVVATGAAMLPFVGEDYFPQVDGGQMQLHVRARSGLRIEDTEKLFAQVEATIRRIVPAEQVALVLSNIGLPANNYNLAFTDGSTVAPNDGQIQVALRPDHAPTAGYMRALRTALREEFPDTMFYFQAADIITQILNFGLPAPIDVQVAGRDLARNKRVAQQLVQRIRAVRGVVDVRLHQILDAPEYQLELGIGLTEQSVGQTLNVSLSGSFQTVPNFWTDPANGIPYQLAVQTPEYRTDTLDELRNTPLTPAGDTGAATLLANVGQLRRSASQSVANHSNTVPVYDVYANLQDRDLGAVESELRQIVAEAQKQLAPGNTITLRGQIESKNRAFARIGLGLVFALVFVYLLMVVNYQTWTEPFVVLLALPLAFVGIIGALFVTGTTLSIPSLMGALMSIGVASANSILLVTFAKEHREETGCSAVEAALSAGAARLRPVLMTAGAMFIGLVPMALGLGDGSEQNAALARAVMGGILIGTCSTLLFVPFLYSTLRRNAATRPLEDYL